MSDLERTLKNLGFHYCAEHLDDIITHATKKRLTPRQLFEHVGHLENQERARRSLERRLSRSKLGPFKPMADFVSGRALDCSERGVPRTFGGSGRPRQPAWASRFILASCCS